MVVDADQWVNIGGSWQDFVACKQNKYEEQEDNADNENHGGHNVDC